MEKELHRAPRVFAALTACLLIGGCGNGEGDTTSTEVTVEGSWSGSYVPPGATRSRPVYALIEKDGTALFYDDAGIMYQMPNLDGGYTFHGAVAAYAPIAYQFMPDAGDMGFSILGTAADSAISADLKNETGTGTLDLTPFETFQDPPSVAAGQWTGYYITPTPFFVALRVSASGEMVGDDVFGCHLTGHMHQRRPGADLFDVTLTTTGPRPICGETFTGLAHEESYDSFDYFKQRPGTYYYMGLLGTHSAFAAELKLN